MKRRGARGQNPGTSKHFTASQNNAPKDAPSILAKPGAPQPPTQPNPQDPARLAPIDEVTSIPPSLYARFEGFELLGRGGMGVVYKARDLRIGRDVAVKLLFGVEMGQGGRQLREARSQARIKHKNVCEIYEAGTADQIGFIVMQLIRGAPLDKAKESMSLEERVYVVREVASALHEAHRLGLVHRDVKPSNIMVEREDDGTYRPYIMDFGLAREMGDTGATMTGNIMGTPAFMAPEQAEGKVRSLDRRTDVYSLGATLYDVIAGRTPFVAEHAWQLLAKVAYEDPPALGTVATAVPHDLEAIVMKCLERNPTHRYESAKALGDDLQRFLDGDPVTARPRSFMYVLWRRAKRHKGKVAIAALGLLAAAVFAGAWVNAQRRAEAQANLSQEIGESVKEMEFFLGNAHGMPLHDINRERNIVRERLKEIEARMITAGEIGVGPGHYALGRGYLALQEPHEALVHLKQAQLAGYQQTGLDYAMGMALSELYKDALVETKWMDEARKKDRIAAIEAEYKQPALNHLRAALGGKIESSAYVEGLIAFYEGKHENALVKAREAFAKAPWFYAATKLEGDVLFAMGKQYGHDAAFDFEKMSTRFREADAAYRLAVEIGSSDPAVYLAACALHSYGMSGARTAAKPIRASFETGKTACENAIAASPTAGAGYVQYALLYATYAWLAAAGLPGEEPAHDAISAAITHANEAARRSPRDPMAQYTVGAAWRAQLLDTRQRGGDLRESTMQAARGYNAALELDPNHTWSLTELCWVLINRGQDEHMHGRDPREFFSSAANHCERAASFDSAFAYPTMNLIILRKHEADHLLELGQSPERPVAQGLSALRAAQARGTAQPTGRMLEARLNYTLAAYAVASGGDPDKSLAEADAAVQLLEKEAPSFDYLDEVRGFVTMVHAAAELERGRDPKVFVDKARAYLSGALEKTPDDIDDRLWLLEVELLDFRWLLQQGQTDKRLLDGAFSLMQPLVGFRGEDPRVGAKLAEIHEARVLLRLVHKENADADIESGLGYAGQTLGKNPRHARGLLVQGKLWLHRAKTRREVKAQRADAQRAIYSFEAAFQSNPLLRRIASKNLEEARELVKDP